jgi:hypothetical protein
MHRQHEIKTCYGPLEPARGVIPGGGPSGPAREIGAGAPVPKLSLLRTVRKVRTGHVPTVNTERQVEQNGNFNFGSVNFQAKWSWSNRSTRAISIGWNNELIGVGFDQCPLYCDETGDVTARPREARHEAAADRQRSRI